MRFLMILWLLPVLAFGAGLAPDTTAALHKVTGKNSRRLSDLLKDRFAAVPNKVKTALRTKKWATSSYNYFSINAISWANGPSQSCGWQATTVTISCDEGGPISIVAAYENAAYGVSGCTGAL